MHVRNPSVAPSRQVFAGFYSGGVLRRFLKDSGQNLSPNVYDTELDKQDLSYHQQY